jgi:nucleotide-binding universal stress UspA family protein
MKILFAADGSQRALAALDLLLARLDWFREQPTITLVNVHPAVPYPGATQWVGRDNLQHYYTEESQKALKSSVDLMQAKGVRHDVVLRVGDAAVEIARHAEEHGYDLIVMGTRGHTGLTNLVLGSVATKVLACSNVPVLFLR